MKILLQFCFDFASILFWFCFNFVSILFWFWLTETKQNKFVYNFVHRNKTKLEKFHRNHQNKTKPKSKRRCLLMISSLLLPFNVFLPIPFHVYSKQILVVPESSLYTVLEFDCIPKRHTPFSWKWITQSVWNLDVLFQDVNGLKISKRMTWNTC